jgi:hypothetical protein
MDYRVLSEDQLQAVQQEKLLALEVAHARLTLDACLAEAAGIPAEQIAPTRRDIAVITAQADALVELMSQPPELPRRTDA